MNIRVLQFILLIYFVYPYITTIIHSFDNITNTLVIRNLTLT